MYNQSRFALIIVLLAANGALSLAELFARRFPLGIGGMLCLIPCLLREMDLRNGLPARQLGKLERSFMLAGALWAFAVYPIVQWQSWQAH